MKAQILVLSSFLALFIFACEKDATQPNSGKSKITQFADSVISFSTEYNPSPGSWSTFQTLGEPNTYPDYGDITTAWAFDNQDDPREFIELYYPIPQRVSKIEIYETYNPGAVDTIYLRNVAGGWNKVWEGTGYDAGDSSRIFTVNIDTTSYKVNAVRLAINSGAVYGWNEIDAVSISGVR